MEKLKVRRFLQEPSHCAFAASSCIGNYWDSNIDYEKTKRIAYKRISKDLNEGLDTGEIGRLLNLLGFQKVTIVCCNLFFLDFSWKRLSKDHLKENLKIAKSKIDINYRDQCSSIYKFLDMSDFDNKLIIDYDFGKYIRDSLNKKVPVIVSINWTMFFKRFKQNDEGIEDPFRGECEDHVLVIYGYNRKNVNVCDSHHEYYKYRLKKYRKGFYSISWENLLSCMSNQDVIIAENYIK